MLDTHFYLFNVIHITHTSHTNNHSFNSYSTHTRAFDIRSRLNQYTLVWSLLLRQKNTMSEHYCYEDFWYKESVKSLSLIILSSHDGACWFITLGQEQPNKWVGNHFLNFLFNMRLSLTLDVSRKIPIKNESIHSYCFTLCQAKTISSIYICIVVITPLWRLLIQRVSSFYTTYWLWYH